MEEKTKLFKLTTNPVNLRTLLPTDEEIELKLRRHIKQSTSNYFPVRLGKGHLHEYIKANSVP